MGIRDDVETARRNRPPNGPRSKLEECVWLLGEKEGAELRDMVADPNVRPVDIYAALGESEELKAAAWEAPSYSAVVQWCRRARMDQRFQ